MIKNQDWKERPVGSEDCGPFGKDDGGLDKGSSSGKEERETTSRERDRLPGSPVVKTSPSSVRDTGSISGQGAEISTCPRAKEPKHKTEAIL